MRYPYQSHRGVRLSRIVVFAALVFVILCLSGCGLVADGVNGLRAIQLPAGKLYDAEFYKTATPEEVKEAIGGRSLADASYTERYYSSNTQGRGFLAKLDGQVKTVQSVFVPMSSVDEAPTVYPLYVAARNTPYPEVVRMLLDAGARPGTARVAEYTASREADPEIRNLLLARSTERERCAALIKTIEAGNWKAMAYCLDTENIPVSCSVGDNSPLTAAVQRRSEAVQKYLLQRGAAIPEGADAQLSLLDATLRESAFDIFWHAVRHGADSSQTREDGENELMYRAARAKTMQPEVLVHLAKTVPLDTKSRKSTLAAACATGNVQVVEIIHARAPGLLREKGVGLQALKSALESGHENVFWFLVNNGADCSEVDANGNNELMRAARAKPQEERLIRYLAERVPVDGLNRWSSLRYAVQKGYAEPVRILLERGATANGNGLTVPETARDREAVIALLRGKGLLAE